MGVTTAVPEIDVTDINLLDRSRFAAGVPHEWFTWLRHNAPIAFHPEPSGRGFYVFTRYEDVIAVAKDAALFSSAKPEVFPNTLEDGGPEFVEMMRLLEGRGTIMNMDAPDHTRYRRLVSRAFTPKTIRALEEHTRALAARVVADGVAKGEVDFTVDLASELPLVVIAELLGVPEADRPRVYRLAHQINGTDDAPDALSPFEALRQICAYAQELAERSRRDPQDDIVGALLSADVDGEALSATDFNVFFFTLFIAGTDTTRHSLSKGMLAFLEHPEQYELLAAHSELAGSATEEVIRWASPVNYTRRNAAIDFDYKGVQFRAGDKVSIWLTSANRDEEVFTDPFTFDITRNPNPHVALGWGPHLCLGAHLARQEIRVFLSELVKQVRSIELVGEPIWLPSNFLSGVAHLPVRLEPR